MKKIYSKKRLEKNLNKGKSLKESTKKILSNLAIERYKNIEFKKDFLRKIRLNPNIYLSSKKTIIIDADSHKIIKEFKSLKDAALYYKVDYRTFRRYRKSGKVYIKYNIIIKYKD